MKMKTSGTSVLDSQLNMHEEAKWLKSILPHDYVCHPTMGGIHCEAMWDGVTKSINRGIDDNDEEHWNYIIAAIAQRYGDRFEGTSHITCFNHMRFIVLIKDI